MQKIDVSMKGGLVRITIQGDEPDPTIPTMSRDMALQIGAALIGLSERDEEPGSLFELAPLMVVNNPRIEVRRSDIGQTILAVMPAKMRPIFLQFDRAQAKALREDLSEA